ncbi:MAG: hypothetical protein INR65_08335 [Gluconacetobacter diazotrophicus]|nr:hypothetical protein [Gluconacetobacter diazotrophicus]
MLMPVTLTSILLAGGCAETTVMSSSNPSRDPARHWRDYDQLPVEMVGTIPGHSATDLAALFPVVPAGAPDGGRHIVFYVNADQLPPKNELCSDVDAFRPGTQHGGAADVTGALCDGHREVTRATGTVVTAEQSPRWLRRGFGVIRAQLFQALFPGTNDPNKYVTQ